MLAVLDLVHQLNAEGGCGPNGQPSASVLAGIGRLIGADVTSYTKVDHRTNKLVGAAVEPAEQNISGSDEFQAVFAQHPGLAGYRSGQLKLGESVAMTDLAELRQLRRLPLYVDFYQSRGTLDQLLCMATLDQRHGTTLALNRSSRGFSERDRAVLDLLTPHLVQASARAVRMAELTTAVHHLSRQADRLDLALDALPGLTRTERAVVEHVAGGLTDRETARVLAVSPRTVQKHLENIYRKLGVSNRTSLAALLDKERF
ncbi:hypothetical protein GCM10023321_28490 [Pseudonocardia eucalypti]|uniref:HTH luxR-type domain-containing protein n=1 Tax=Pseudonocardia eucalypti TaxID=648755 RepID=A0ABP9Q2C4_9PSEU